MIANRVIPHREGIEPFRHAHGPIEGFHLQGNVDTIAGSIPGRLLQQLMQMLNRNEQGFENVRQELEPGSVGVALSRRSWNGSHRLSSFAQTNRERDVVFGELTHGKTVHDRTVDVLGPFVRKWMKDEGQTTAHS